MKSNNNEEETFDDNDSLQVTKVIHIEIKKLKTEIFIITDKINDKIKSLRSSISNFLQLYNDFEKVKSLQKVQN